MPDREPVREPLILSMTDACRQLGVSKVTFRRYLDRGEFPNAFRLDANWRIPKSDIDAFKAKCRKRTRRTEAATST